MATRKTAGKSLQSAAKKGDRRALLEAMRDKLAKTIDASASGRDIAALSKRLMEVSAELDSMPNPEASMNPLELEQKRVADKRAKRTG